MMEVNMKVYDCKNPEENQLPKWLTGKQKPAEKKEDDFEAYQREQVRRFKESPESFFPSFYPSSRLEKR